MSRSGNPYKDNEIEALKVISNSFQSLKKSIEVDVKCSHNKLRIYSVSFIISRRVGEDPEIYLKGSGLSLRTTNQKNHVDLAFFR